ncbi:hypothetical protein BKA70DRAFT_1394021 [Coprinopsis sp. MPI-PUGE-AT-0042]|nr:hypothetical protein BKA70DRAFT_1394021 [Coprinopsis sp. MPI-PUGE-AT-0042]
MFVPFFSEPSVERRKLWRRKGGGGGGKGGGGGGGRGSTSSGGSGGGGGGRSVTSISSAGGSRGVSSYSPGGGRSVAITSGPYAGRQQGGGTRSNVYGSKTYGSGYPGGGGRGTAGLGFPFIFWPLSFGALGFAGSYAYLNGNNEYGRPDDESRPGGPQTVAIIPSANSGSNTTFRFLTDRDSVEAMKPILVQECGSMIQNNDNIATERYNGSTVTPPRPEQVVQYFRASTAALSLDGYNNTAIFEEEGTPDVSLPANIDTSLLECLNKTIGDAIPLEDNAGLSHSPAPLAIFTIVGVLLAFM